ncbi:bifunctional non-homologous end joining protein LigD [Jatrophihabitans endophyticus]|uniref:Bifunctional non-homologous end joining protein LigD n=1 Tax=Jatrophihabitans endophyticus TaxID=1206085 RepID=A0A1M5EUS7_9ACTN|nr:non-homologous end-joining DNA ligase [Jatrophihabitans endophyticus]SHF83015.1 bifunctional non-homologous end joining protein LigD [Jatrophihabitans endophyticus]
MPDKGEKVTVEVDGHRLTLSNLGKVLYPEAGFAKGEVIDYYSRIAPVLLPHLADRALTVKRYPNGVDDTFFFEKNASRSTPSWVRTINLPAPGSTKNRETIDYIVVEELPTLVFLANLAALELHVPQWRIPRRARTPRTDLVVFDLDPGPPATIVECCEVALLLRDLLVEDGMTPLAKTSGSKGMQVSVPVEVDDPAHTSDYAHAIARRLERARPDLVVSRMLKSLRPEKILVDWSQNNPAKTTVAPYSLRARPQPTVSTPLTWDEVEAGQHLSFTAHEVLARVDEHGDLFAPVLADGNRVRITGAMLADR